MTRPPLGARILLRLLLPWRLFESIAGDLEEDWRDGRLSKGRYWLLALRSIADCRVLLRTGRAARLPAQAPTGDALMISMFHDIRYGSRMMRKHLGFTLAAVGTLAVGVGATSAIFSLIKAVRFEPLPYHDASRVAFLLGTDTGTGDLRFSVRLADYVDISRRARSFRHVAAYSPVGGNLTGGDRPERVQAYRVTGTTFDLLGVPAALGRGLTESDARAGRVAVLSDGLWRRRFGGETDVIGRRIDLNGVTHEVIGVMPAGFDFPVFNFKGDVWVPWAFDASAAAADRAASGSATVIARLADGVRIDQAAAEMRALMQSLASDHPATNASLGVRVVEMGRLDDEQAGAAMSMVVLTVAIVLLLACGNVANLLLARGASRGRELAVRTAVGASRARILRQLLVESAMLALLGGLLGVVLAHFALGAIRASLPELILSTMPNIGTIRVDGLTLAFTLAVSIAASLVFGILPAWRAARPRPQDALRSPVQGGWHGARRLRSSLVVAEVALATLVLVGAGLLVRSYAGLRAVDPGFAAEGLLTMAIALPEDRYGADADRRRFFAELTERVDRLPGVESAALVNVLPFSTYDRGTRVEIDGAPAPPPDRELPAALRVVSPAYFDTMAMAIAAGRVFTAGDRADSLPVAVVNRAFASRYLPGDPVGRRVRLGDERSGNPWMTVLGVVADVRHSQLARAPGPEIYLPLAQTAPPMMMLAVRATGEPLDLAAPIRQEVLAIDPRQPVFHVKPMTEMIDEALVGHTASAALVAVLGGIALLLAVIGVYSVISYGVTRQMPEFGLRLALGAAPAALVRGVIVRGLRLLGAGLLLGAGAAAALSGGLAGLLYGIDPLDPLTYATVACGIAALGIVATAIPAARAATAEPLSALRAD